MGTYDRRTFLKHSAMLTATVAAGHVFLSSVSGVPAATNQQGADHPFFAQAKNRPRPEVIAHRGGDGQWPGETMFAMRQAMKIGADVLEMDVYLTKKVEGDNKQDGELVLMHDINIEVTTEARCLINKNCSVNKFTSAELQKLNAAYNWSNDKGKSRPYRNAEKLTAEIENDLRVPKLEEVFKEFPNTRMVIEMKKAPPEFSPVTKLCELIQTHHMENNVLVASFHAPFMKEFRKKLPQVATSVTLSFEDWKTSFGNLKNAFQGLVNFLDDLERDSAIDEPAKPVAIQLPYQLITDWIVKRVRSNNLVLHAWTVNNMVAMNKMKTLGVDGIITDYPGPLLAILNRLKAA